MNNEQLLIFFKRIVKEINQFHYFGRFDGLSEIHEDWQIKHPLWVKWGDHIIRVNRRKELSCLLVFDDFEKETRSGLTTQEIITILTAWK